jgi:hypothetical protein
MLFMVNLMLVVMLVLDCLMSVYGVCYGVCRMEHRSEYQACLNNPAVCTSMYAARPPPRAACASP